MRIFSRVMHVLFFVAAAYASLVPAATGVGAANGVAELDRRIDYWRTRLPF